MKFLIIGGDKRNLKLAQLLNDDGHKTKICGFEKHENNDKTHDIEIMKIDQLQHIAPKEFDAIIGPIPFTIDGIYLNAPLSETKILLDDLLQNIKNYTLIAGPISEIIKKKIDNQNIKNIDIMEIEEFIVYNSIATAEGAIKTAIENTEINLHEGNILILGFGRVAKTLAIKLKGLSQNITCAARKQNDLAWIETLGFKSQDINKLGHKLKEYDIIINTVPQNILKQDEIKKETLFIELASKPGGIEFDDEKNVEFNYISAQGLPGKLAPLSSAKYIKQTIYNIMQIK